MSIVIFFATTFQPLSATRRFFLSLHKAGVIDAVTLRDFDAFCLPPVKTYTAAQIKRMHVRSKASQAVFAAYLNTSPSTVQKWERGQKKRTDLHSSCSIWWIKMVWRCKTNVCFDKQGKFDHAEPRL